MVAMMLSHDAGKRKARNRKRPAETPRVAAPSRRSGSARPNARPDAPSLFVNPYFYGAVVVSLLLWAGILAMLI